MGPILGTRCRLPSSGSNDEIIMMPGGKGVVGLRHRFGFGFGN